MATHEMKVCLTEMEQLQARMLKIQREKEEKDAEEKKKLKD